MANPALSSLPQWLNHMKPDQRQALLVWIMADMDCLPETWEIVCGQENALGQVTPEKVYDCLNQLSVEHQVQWVLFQEFGIDSVHHPTWKGLVSAAAHRLTRDEHQPLLSPAIA